MQPDLKRHRASSSNPVSAGISRDILGPNWIVPMQETGRDNGNKRVVASTKEEKEFGASIKNLARSIIQMGFGYSASGQEYRLKE
jgi:hypothetical protein